MGNASGPAISIVPFTGSATARLGDRSREIFCRHRLEQRVRQAHCVTFDGRLRDATEELEEPGGTDNCVWSGRVLDKALLRKFGAEITAVEQALGSDNREGDVMLDAGGRFRRREVLAGRLEEIHCSLICE